MKKIALLILILSSGQIFSQYNNPNDITFNANTGSYYVTNQKGKNVVEWKSNNTTSVFISGLTKPKAIAYDVMPFGAGFLVLDSNEMKVYDGTGGFLINQGFAGAMELHDLAFDKATQTIYITDIKRHYIYKVVIGPAPFYTPTITTLTTAIRNPTGVYLDKAKNRILVVSDTAKSPIYAVNLTSAAVTNVYNTGLDNLYGIDADGQGNIYVTSWGQDNLYFINKYFTGSPKQLLVASDPAKPYFHAAADLMLFPCFNCNKIMQLKIHNFGPGFELQSCPKDTVVSYKNILLTNYGTYEEGNLFKLELSDSNGKFTSPKVLASIKDTLIPSELKGGLPSGLIGGKNYKLRWSSTKPTITGTSELFEVLQSPEPEAYSADTAYVCNGSNIDLGVSTGNIFKNQYRWNPSAFLSSDTVARPTAIVSVLKKYYVQVTNRISGCRTADSVVVKPISNPQTSFLPDSVLLCAGDSAYIGNNQAPDFDYIWQPAQNIDNSISKNPLVWPSASTKYLVNVSAGTCFTNDSVIITVNPLPVFSFTQDTLTICNGDTTILGIGVPVNANWTYKWLPVLDISYSGNPTTPCYVSSSQNYGLRVTINNTGCVAVKSQYVTVKPLPAQPNITVPSGQNKLVCNANAPFYQWYLNDTLMPGSNMKEIIPAISGKYKVKIQGVNGCYRVSDVFDFAKAGLNGIVYTNLKVYPNPTTGNIIFDLPSGHKVSKSELSLSDGRIIDGQKWTINSNHLNLSNLSSGVYFLRIETNSRIFIGKIQLAK